MKVLRTPDDRFQNLPDYPFRPHYLEISDEALGSLRVHYVDEGAADAPVVLCLHGEPSWSYLYRFMIPIFVDAGFRVIAPDLIGFGKSDKPAEKSAYSYNGHVRWMSQWLQALDLQNITLVAQDWGGLIGLRLLAEMPDRFARVSISNTGLPTGDQPMAEAFMQWREYSQVVEDFDAGAIIANFTPREFSEAEINAYRAPFPSDDYKAGARQFPLLVPVSPDNPATEANRQAWQVLSQWQKPFLLCFSDGDPITAGLQKVFLERVPGAKNQPHAVLHGGHFIQEVDGERWANRVVDWCGTGSCNG